MRHHSDHRGRKHMFREAMRAYAEHMGDHIEMGRHGRHGFGRRFGRGGEEGDEGEGGFGWGFGGPRGGRVLGHGDLRLLLLALIGEKPRHGYDLIKAVEERFAGAYAPSPGAVYPTLTMLGEQDYVRAEAAEGSKKLFSITPEGRAFLKENEAQVDGILSRVDLVATAFVRQSAPDDVREAWKTLRQAMNMRRTPWTKEEVERVRAILAKATKDIMGRE